MRAVKARRKPHVKSYEAIIDGTILIEALSQREAVAKAKEFAHRNKIKLSNSHVQVFLLRQPKPIFKDGGDNDGDWDKEAL